MIFRNHYNILIYCSRNVIINVENSCAASCFCENRYKLFQESDEQISKEQLKNSNLSKIKNVFTVTFDQFNASLMTRSTHFFKKKKVCVYIYIYIRLQLTIILIID